jgi:hypothetical protein
MNMEERLNGIHVYRNKNLIKWKGSKLTAVIQIT